MTVNVSDEPASIVDTRPSISISSLHMYCPAAKKHALGSFPSLSALARSLSTILPAGSVDSVHVHSPLSGSSMHVSTVTMVGSASPDSAVGVATGGSSVPPGSPSWAARGPADSISTTARPRPASNPSASGI